MDRDRFDQLAVAFARRSRRRGALRWLAGTSLGAALWAGSAPTASAIPITYCSKEPPRCAQNRAPVNVGGGQCHCACKENGPAGCCRGEKECGEACIKKEKCCPLTERECRKKVGGEIRAFCIPREKCCPGHETCPIARDGCCNPTAGEQCAKFDGCCDVLNSNKHVCDKKWCCKEGQKCKDGVGCYTPPTCPPGSRECVGRNRSACCTGTAFCCDGVCCATNPELSRCCPNRTGNPCVANVVPC